MKYLIIFLLMHKVLWAGNGSSGVGTAMIGDHIVITSLDDIVTVEKGYLIKRIDQNKLMKITPLLSRPTVSVDIAASKFGNVNGFEYLPELKSRKKNYWIVCAKLLTNECYRLDALNTKDKLIPSILGSLEYLK